MISELEAREEDYLRKHGPRVYRCAECDDAEVSVKGGVCIDCLIQITGGVSEEPDPAADRDEPAHENWNEEN